MPPRRKVRGKRRNDDGQGDQESQPEVTTSPVTTTTTPAAAAAAATPQFEAEGDVDLKKTQSLQSVDLLKGTSRSWRSFSRRTLVFTTKAGQISSPFFHISVFV